MVVRVVGAGASCEVDCVERLIRLNDDEADLEVVFKTTVEFRLPEELLIAVEFEFRITEDDDDLEKKLELNENDALVANVTVVARTRG